MPLLTLLMLVVGGTPAGRRRLLQFSIVVGTTGAFSGALYTCNGCSPAGGPGPDPTATQPPPPPTMPTVDPPPPPPPGEEPGTTGGQPHEPPASKCVFVRPVFRQRSVEVELKASRIVGGTPATEEEAKRMVSLQTTDGRHFCGGSMFGGRYVLTAAHCMVFQHFKAVVGRYDLRTSEGFEYLVSSAQVKMPAREGSDGAPVGLYDDEEFDWDAALVDLGQKAGEELELYDGALRADDGKPKETQTLGWGRVFNGGALSPILLKLKQTTPVISQFECRATYPQLTPRMVCGDREGSGSCQGDSGGPLLIDGRRVGIVSYGRGCAEGWPGVYSYLGVDRAPWTSGVFGYSGEIGEWVRACTQ